MVIMKRPGHPAIVLIATVLLFCLDVAAQNTTPTPRPEEPTTGSLTGKVISDNGQPLAGVTIYLRASSTFSMGRATVTDSEGNFQLNNLDSALYQVYANSPAYIFEQRDPDAPPIYYRIGDSVRLELTRGGVITGAVTNNLGEPVVSVPVRVHLIRDAKGQRSPIPAFTPERSTDDRGIYRIYGLAPGTYLVSAGGTTYQQFQRSPYDSDAPTYAPSSTRDNAAEITVRAGEESSADIRYRGEPGRRISGTVKNVTAQGASVFLSIAGTGLLPAYNTYMQADSRGFAFYGIPDGDYDIVAQQNVSVSPGTPGEIMMSEPRRITVSGKDIAGVELNTSPMASIYGTITLESSKAAECQNKRRPTFAETVVDVVRNTKQQDEQSPFLRTYISSSQPDKNGKFSVRNIRNGQYTFIPKFFARYWYVESITTASQSKTPAPKGGPVKTDAVKNWLSLKSGDRLTDFNIVLNEGAASIRGQLALPEETKPVENLRVFVVPAEREKADDPLRFSVATVSPEGTFAVNNLAPGRYFILAQLNLDAELSPEKIRLPNAAEARTKLRRAAETARIELELKPCQNLTEYKLNTKTP
jgi:hypothetical protein